MKQNENLLILGSFLLSYSIFGTVFGNLAVQELGGQTNTKFFSEELKLDLRESNRIGQHFAFLSITATWLLSISIPVFLHGLINLRKKYCVITGIGILVLVGILYVPAMVFYSGFG